MAEGDGEPQPTKGRSSRRGKRVLSIRLEPDEFADVHARARENHFSSVSEYVRRALEQVAKSGEPPKPRVESKAAGQPVGPVEQGLLEAEARVVEGYRGTLMAVNDSLEKLAALQAEALVRIAEAYRGFLSHTPAIPDAQRELFARSANERYRRWEASVRTLLENSASSLESRPSDRDERDR